MDGEKVNGIARDDDEVIIRAGDDDEGNDSQSGIPIIEPATIRFEPDASESAEPKRRGRKSGSKNASSRGERKEKANDLTAIMLGLHSMGAVLLRTPELELSKDEAEKLGNAVSRVNEVYGGYVISPKAAAVLALTFTVGEVYGPRVLAHSIRKKTEREESKAHRGRVQTINAVM